MKPSTYYAIAAAIAVIILYPSVGHSAPHDANWNRVQHCETGGEPDPWRYGPKHHTGRWSGFYGGLQFDRKTWTGAVRHHRHLERYETADLAPAWAQRAAAEIVRRRRGLEPWPRCGRLFYA